MLTRVRIASSNYGSRGGSTVVRIVLHTAEGARTYQSLGSYFQGNVSASSHVGIDDTPNTVGEYVPRTASAWTQAAANPWSVSAELCAFAAWNIAEWDRHPQMLANCAAWIAEEAAAFGIPITRLTSGAAQNPAARGVCQHVDLGAMGGGHSDCGPAFPIDQVLQLASGVIPTPPPEPEEVDMIILRSPAGAMCLCNGSTKAAIPDPQSAAALQAAGVKVVNVTQATFDAIKYA